MELCYGRAGYIDRTGRFIIECSLDNSSKAFSIFGGNYLYVSKYEGRDIFKNIIVDNKGNIINSDYPYSFLTGFFDEELGKSYEVISITDEDYRKDYYGVINDKFQVVIPPVHEELAAITAREGLRLFQKDNKFGFSDMNGKVVIDAKYDKAEHFKNGMAKVYIDGKAGVIDKTGKFVIPAKYSEIRDFYNYQNVTLPEEWATKYNDLFFYIIYDGDRISNWGYIDKTGKELL